MLKVAGGAGVTRRAIKDFLGDDAWRFPASSRVKAKQLHRIFDEKRIPSKASESHKVKCSCAEGLGVYGLLRLSGKPLRAPPLSSAPAAYAM